MQDRDRQYGEVMAELRAVKKGGVPSDLIDRLDALLKDYSDYARKAEGTAAFGEIIGRNTAVVEGAEGHLADIAEGIKRREAVFGNKYVVLSVIGGLFIVILFLLGADVEGIVRSVRCQ